MNTDGNTDAINRHLDEREEHDAWQDGRDAIEALADAEERIEELQRACEVVSSEFEGELWQACRRLLKKTGFDFHGADVDGIQSADFESHMNETLAAFDRAEAKLAKLPVAYRLGLEAGVNECEMGAHIMSHHGSQTQEDCYTNAAKAIRALPTPADLAEQCGKETIHD